MLCAGLVKQYASVWKIDRYVPTLVRFAIRILRDPEALNAGECCDFSIPETF